MGKLFVWDFHGVLEEGNDGTVIEITNKILARHGHKSSLTEQEAAAYTGKHWWEYFAHLMPGLPSATYRLLEAECVAEFNAHPEVMLKYIKPNRNALEVLETLALRHTQIVVSQVHQNTLELFLKAVGLTRFFPDKHAIATLDENKSKQQALRDFMNGQVYNSIVAIGDSPHDMLGTVNYHYVHPGRKHRECDAHYKVNNLTDVLREF